MTTTTLEDRGSLIQAGDEAPNFMLSDQDRGEWTLAEHLKNGDVLLCFFPFAFTGVCSTEMACLSKELAEAEKSGVTAVGISGDSFASLKAWADQEGFSHRLLSDSHRAVCKAYGLYWSELNVARRGTVLIGKDGRVKWSQSREPGEGMNWDEVQAKMS